MRVVLIIVTIVMPIILFAGTVIVAFAVYIDSQAPQIEVGQTWVRYDENDPFKQFKRDTLRVLDVKNGFAKVVIDGDTTSMEHSRVYLNRILVTK